MEDEMQIQQGDVWFEKATIPAAATQVQGAVFAEGEGHHVHRAAVAENVQMYTLDGVRYARVLQDTEVEHVTPGGGRGEHNTVTLPTGDYAFGQIVEFDYLAEMARAVVD